MLAGVGDELEEVRRPVTDASGGFAAARERRSADGATQRRPSHRRAPRGLPLPVRAATLVVNRWARSALSAAVVPVRPPHRGPAPLRQDRPGLAGERHQYTSLMLPGHSNPLLNHCLAVIARRSNPVHGHPLDPPINRGPELQLEPTPPLHST